MKMLKILQQKNNIQKEGESVTNSELLKDRIEKSGLRYDFIAEQLTMSVYWFKKKVNNEKNFHAWEIQLLCKLLNITSLREKDRIFFAENVEKSSTEV